MKKVSALLMSLLLIASCFPVKAGWLQRAKKIFIQNNFVEVFEGYHQDEMNEIIAFHESRGYKLINVSMASNKYGHHAILTFEKIQVKTE